MNLLICPPKRSQHQCLTGIYRSHRLKASSKLGVLSFVHHGPLMSTCKSLLLSSNSDAEACWSSANPLPQQPIQASPLDHLS